MAEYTERNDNAAFLEDEFASDDDGDDDRQFEIPRAPEVLPRLLNRGKSKTLANIMVWFVFFLLLFVLPLLLFNFPHLFLPFRKKIFLFSKRLPAFSGISRTNQSSSTGQPSSRAGRSFDSRPLPPSPSVTPIFGGGTPTCKSSCYFQQRIKFPRFSRSHKEKIRESRTNKSASPL